MAYDEKLAQRIREQFEGLPGIEEKKMFGGIAFLLNGNMATGVIGENLIVRVGAEHYQSALQQPHAHPFDFSGRPMKGWVMVAPDGYASDMDLKIWVKQGLDYAHSLEHK